MIIAIYLNYLLNLKRFILDGLFKETNYGKWVHLVCALYIPGIRFEEVNIMKTVILFSNSPPRWGIKRCNLCEDEKFAFTGVTIKCDAGMCKSNFHVTWYNKHFFN